VEEGDDTVATIYLVINVDKGDSQQTARDLAQFLTERQRRADSLEFRAADLKVLDLSRYGAFLPNPATRRLDEFDLLDLEQVALRPCDVVLWTQPNPVHWLLMSARTTAEEGERRLGERVSTDGCRSVTVTRERDGSYCFEPDGILGERLCESTDWIVHLPDLAREFPDEPLVDCPRPRPSPFETADHWLADRQEFIPKLFGADSRQVSRAATRAELRRCDKLLVRRGPAIDPAWESELADPFFFISTQRKSDDAAPALPRVDGASAVDRLLYLRVTGQLPGKVPLRLARAVADEDWSWRIPLSELSRIGPTLEETPEIPEDGWLLQNLELDKDRLVLRFVDERFMLADGWRRRHRAIVCDAECWGDGDPGHASKVEQCPIWARVGRQLLWLSGNEMPAAFREANVVPLIDLREKLARRLAAVGSAVDATRPADGVNAAIDRLVRGIGRVYAPGVWPFKARPADDPARRLDSAAALGAMAPLLDQLTTAPLNDDLHEPIASFVSLWQGRRGLALGRALEWVHAWAFQLKTPDHTWINGRVWRHPLRRRDAEKLEVLRREPRPSAGAALIAAGDVVCFLRETKG
jgi:hypothetical protein